MSTPAIKVEGLGKRYRLTHGQQREGYRTLRDSIVGAVKSPFRKKATTEDFWALDDVSFEVQPGEVVGIIGRNGAGKSTLLKILSRITKPTRGHIEINGRVGSLLEVGTGFHPELTGRENVYLNGSILGMSRSEIKAKFDEIVAFAEVEKFLDTPVKRYSSGMYVRLAFAVAAHLEPEILIVDEVLAVGDAGFQKKCLGKMGEVAKNGRTVLFVSHNMSSIQTLCDRAIVILSGRVIRDGVPTDVVPAYLAETSAGLHYTGIETKPIWIKSATLRTNDDGNANFMDIEFDICSNVSARVALDVRLSDAVGTPVAYGSLGAFSDSEMIRVSPGNTRVITRHDVRQLAVGTYLISVDLTRPDIEYLERLENCLAFDCMSPARISAGKRLMQHWNKGSWELPMLRIDTKERL